MSTHQHRNHSFHHQLSLRCGASHCLLGTLVSGARRPHHTGSRGSLVPQEQVTPVPTGGHQRTENLALAQTPAWFQVFPPFPGSGDRSLGLAPLTSSWLVVQPAQLTGPELMLAAPSFTHWLWWISSLASISCLARPSIQPCCCFRNLPGPAAQTRKLGASCLHHAAKATCPLH